MTVGSPSAHRRYSALKHLAFMLLFLLGSLNVWATSVTWPGTSALPGTATSIASDANVTIMTSATNSYTNPIRVYANNTITIAVASGYTIESVTYEASSTGNYVTYAQEATVSPSVTPAVSGKNVTWSFSSTTTTFTFAPSSQTRSNGITVVYSSTGGDEPGGGDDPEPGEETAGTGTIEFGTSKVKIDAASDSGDDNLGNTWTITTVGTTSFTPQPTYSQVGSGNKPASSITFTTTLSQEMKVSAFSAKFGGFGGTAGTVTLKVGDTTVGTGSLDAGNDVTVEADDEATGTVLTVTVTGISKGVKVYYISYTLEEPSTPDPGKDDLADDDFKWSAASYTATIGASNTFPTLTNAQNVEFSYQSSNDAVATISNEDGHKGEISLLKAGTTTIKAVFDGNDTYNAKTVSYALTVKDAPLATMDAIFAKATAVGTTATDVDITFSNWVVSGAKGKTAYVTDGTKGFIIYYDDHGFAEGDILSGTGSFKLKLYNGAAEITAKNSGTITITKGGSAALNVLDEEGIAGLSGINTGSLIKIGGAATQNGTRYYIAGVQLYTTLCDNYTNPTADNDYECVGVYVYFKSGNNAAVNEIMPRVATDLKEIVPAGAPEFTPASKKFVGSIDVTLSQSASLPIYYTDNASIKDDPSTSTWTEYTSAINVTATKTIYAAAKDGDNWSDVNSATYTKAEPLTTMAAVQAAATSTESNIDVTINNWVVTGVDGSQVWLTDASNEKGILLYKSSNGFAVKKKLNGTVFDTKIKLWNNYPELTSLVASDVSATDAEAITPRVTTIAALTSGHPAEQGTIVKLENLTYNGSVFSDGTNTITIDTRFFEPSLTSGKKYDLSGVVYYGSTVATIKIMPRETTDVVELASHDLTSITLGGTYPTTFETGDAFSHEGMVVTAHYEGAEDETVTASAEFSGYDMSVANTYEVTVSYTEGEITKTAKYNITVSDPAPTGDFEELDGELVAGDYLIYDGGSLMIAQIESSRFYYEGATPDANGIISNPSGYAVWTLAKSGDYWTFYNAKAGKYAAATGASGKAQLMDSNSDDKAKWTVDGDLVVTNKYNTDNEVNATLRHNFSGNSNYGFACYSATTGSKPVFYKQATPSYYISETLTGCTADANNPTKVPQALTEDVVLKYNLSTGYVWPNEITVTVGGVELDANELDYLWDTDKAPAELTIAKEKVNGNIAITITAIEKSLDNITITQAPKVAYETGEFFNPAGLQIQLNYTAGAASDVVVYSNETKDAFTFSPNLETALAPANTEVTITYGGKSVNQAITVTDPVAEAKTVVIIAEFDSKFYAMSNAVANSQCVAIEVTKNGDNLVVSSDEDKAAIQWYMSKLGSTVNLQEADENGKYLSGNSSNASFAESDDKVDLTMTQADGKYIISAGGARAIMYRSTGVFKHYATSSSESEYAKVSEIFEVADGATNIEVVVPVVHEFVVDPDEDVDFGTVEQGDDVAAKSFEVTLTNISSATVTLEGGNGAFSIDKSTLDENGGTITVTPNTANAGNFSATITLHDEDDAAADKVINVTMKVVAPKDCDRTDDFYTVGANNNYENRTSDEGWSAVNTAVVVNEEVTYWMINGKTSTKGVITSPEFNYGIKELSFDYYYSFNESNGISFKVEIKQNGSVVKTETITKADAVKNTIYSATIENIDLEGKYQIVFTNLCPTGKSSGNADRYAIGNLCWKKYGEPVYETVRSGLEINRYYTVCLSKKVTAIKGASFWTLNNKSQDGATAYLEEETNNLPFAAGKPFIIQATAEKLEVVYEGAATEDAGTNGALHGTLVYMDAAALAAAGSDVYMLFSNELRPVGENNHLDANRAYVLLSELNAVAEAPQSAPGKRVRAMPMQPQVATGFEAAEANEAPRKVLINGELFILRGAKMYDAKGQLVK